MTFVAMWLPIWTFILRNVNPQAPNRPPNPNIREGILLCILACLGRLPINFIRAHAEKSNRAFCFVKICQQQKC
jgi:hypothetical protein